MATYSELHNILTDNVAGAQALRDRVGVACLVAADIIASGQDTSDPPWSAGGHEQRQKWVVTLLSAYASTTRSVFSMVVAANATATQAQILTATDAVLQDAVNQTIDTLAAHL